MKTVEELFEEYIESYKKNQGAPQPEGHQTANLYRQQLKSDKVGIDDHTECLYFIAFLANELNKARLQ